MRRHMFGWSYPPGAANDPYAPWNQEEGPCAICCKPPDVCICPECPECGQQGNPTCYYHSADFAVGLNSSEGHGLRLTREQVIGRAEAEVRQCLERVAAAEQALTYLKDGGEFSDDLAHNPDPWR